MDHVYGCGGETVVNIIIQCSRCGSQMVVRSYASHRDKDGDTTWAFDIDCPECSMEMESLRYAERMRPEEGVGGA